MLDLPMFLERCATSVNAGLDVDKHPRGSRAILRARFWTVSRLQIRIRAAAGPHQGQSPVDGSRNSSAIRTQSAGKQDAPSSCCVIRAARAAVQVLRAWSGRAEAASTCGRRARLAAAQGGQHDAQDGPCHYGNFEGFLPRMIDIAALQAPE
jgi:hypothetical protein